MAFIVAESMRANWIGSTTSSVRGGQGLQPGRWGITTLKMCYAAFGSNPGCAAKRPTEAPYPGARKD